MKERRTLHLRHTREGAAPASSSGKDKEAKRDSRVRGNDDEGGNAA